MFFSYRKDTQWSIDGLRKIPRLLCGDIITQRVTMCSIHGLRSQKSFIQENLWCNSMLLKKVYRVCIRSMVHLSLWHDFVYDRMSLFSTESFILVVAAICTEDIFGNLFTNCHNPLRETPKMLGCILSSTITWMRMWTSVSVFNIITAINTSWLLLSMKVNLAYNAWSN